MTEVTEVMEVLEVTEEVVGVVFFSLVVSRERPHVAGTSPV